MLKCLLLAGEIGENLRPSLIIKPPSSTRVVSLVHKLFPVTDLINLIKNVVKFNLFLSITILAVQEVWTKTALSSVSRFVFTRFPLLVKTSVDN